MKSQGDSLELGHLSQGIKALPVATSTCILTATVRCTAQVQGVSPVTAHHTFRPPSEGEWIANIQGAI